MAEEEKKEIKQESILNKLKEESPKRELVLNEIAGRVAIYLAFLTLITGFVIKIYSKDIPLVIDMSSFIWLTLVWLVTAIAIILWNIHHELIKQRKQ